MPVPNETLDKPKIDASQKRWGSSPLYILLLCALILCSALFFTSYRHPSTTYAVAPAISEQLKPAEVVQVQVNKTTKSTDNLAITPSIWPIRGMVTSGFGLRISPFGDGNELHQGLDIAATMGAPVVATADGQVVQSGWTGDFGNMVQIDHGNGVATIYGHNSQLSVSVGQSVKKGQVISYVGSTGKSTGPHVHYEIRENGTAVDPWKYLVSY
ncbi:MAG: M23 family metallopeptidase [Negativicutes bacterium]|nr:M23 family metallopeptidase [Negativicutes bacterium]